MAGVAFFITGIGYLKGGGGAERFFSDLYDEYRMSADRKFDLYFITDQASVNNLRSVGKLKTSQHVLNFKLISNRFKRQAEALQLYWFIIRHRIKIIHIPLYDLSYLPVLKSINRLPDIFRPKLAINIVNCYAGIALADKTNPYHAGCQATYMPLFKEVNVDGYFCWNTNFEHYLSSKVFAYEPKKVQSITSRFSDVRNYKPDHKKNRIVFASRLDDQKHPIFLLEAVKGISETHPRLLSDWKVMVCGDGPLRQSLMDYAEKHKLSEFVEFCIEGEMFKILNSSRIYVSCQDYDNFPSLTMSEAMASGNAIIARHVGQTALFVKDEINGLLIEPDSSVGLSKALIRLMSHPEQIPAMASQSINLIKDVHNVPNFIRQIDHFWHSLLN